MKVVANNDDDEGFVEAGDGEQMLETTIEEGGLPPFTAIYLKIRSMLSRSAVQLVAEAVQ